MLISWKLCLLLRVLFWQKPQSIIIYRQWLLLYTPQILTRSPWHWCSNRWSFLSKSKAENPQVTLSGLLLRIKHKSKEEYALIIQYAHHWYFMLSTVLLSLTHGEHILVTFWEFVYLPENISTIKEQFSCLKQRSETKMWFHPVLDQMREGGHLFQW